MNLYIIQKVQKVTGKILNNSWQIDINDNCSEMQKGEWGTRAQVGDERKTRETFVITNALACMSASDH